MGQSYDFGFTPVKECGTPDTRWGFRVSHQHAVFSMLFPAPLLPDREQAAFRDEMHAAMLPIVERLYERRWQQMFAGKRDQEGRLYPERYADLWPTPAESGAGVCQGSEADTAQCGLPPDEPRPSPTTPNTMEGDAS